jgi:hypothetical protein
VLIGGSGSGLGSGEGRDLVYRSDNDIHDVVEVGSRRNCHDRDMGRTRSGLEWIWVEVDLTWTRGGSDWI